MKAVIRAILLDPEARDIDAHEPRRRHACASRSCGWRNFLRAFQATLDQRLLPGSAAPTTRHRAWASRRCARRSVFNFYRPGYAPPGTAIAQDGLVAPELQITNEVSVAGYLNYMRNWVVAAQHAAARCAAQLRRPIARWPTTRCALVERMNLLLMGGQMPVDAARQDRAGGWRPRGAGAHHRSAGVVTNQAAIDNARLDRVRIAALLTMSCTRLPGPEVKRISA